MKGKKAIVFMLAMALLPQSAGAISVTYSDSEPQSSQSFQLSPAARFDLVRVYKYRWATTPSSATSNGRPENGSSSLGGGSIPPNNGGASLGNTRPVNSSSSLAGRLSLQDRPENNGSSLGGGRTPSESSTGIQISYTNDSSRPENGSGSLGGGAMPNNSGSSLGGSTTPPNNSGSSLGGGRMPEGSYSGITVTYADDASYTGRPDNSSGSLGGGRMPAPRPDNSSDSLGGGKMPDNSAPSLEGALGSNETGRPDNSGPSLGSSGSSTRPDNSAPSLASQIEENERPDNSAPSLESQLADDEDEDNDYNDNDNESDTNLCDGRKYPRDIDGHWSEIYVRRLYDLCVVEGYLDGLFHPNAYVTRAELVKMGLFANGIEANRGCYDNDCGSPFHDLDEWQGPWVRTAWDNKIIQGYNLNEFRPNQAITRAEAVKVVLATYGYGPINTTESFFKDVNGWSTGWIERARIIGLVQGIGNGNFDPNRPITRAEASKIIAKMIEHWDTNVSYDNQYRG